MAKSFHELRSKLSPSSEALSAAEYARLTEELPLQDVRETGELNEARTAAQPEIAEP